MGINKSVKNMLAGDGNEYLRTTRTDSNAMLDHKLPPGTGPGTSGKPVVGDNGHAEETTQNRVVNTRSSTQQDTNPEIAATGHNSNVDRCGAGPLQNISPIKGSLTAKLDSRGQHRVLEGEHVSGHSVHNSPDATPSGNAEERTEQLDAVTHEKVRRVEVEEVSRVKDRERHVHHIQHHSQPVIASEDLPEQHHELIHPITQVKEMHANKVDENSFFEGQIRQHSDSLEHGPKVRNIVDKGTTVNESTHHHIHHVIQPVIEKETFDRHRIHTTIPIHEVSHEAPVVHQSQTHAAIPLEHFLERGGSLKGALHRDDVKEKVLRGGPCVRDVDGVAESLERDLNLGKPVGRSE